MTCTNPACTDLPLTQPLILGMFNSLYVVNFPQDYELLINFSLPNFHHALTATVEALVSRHPQDAKKVFINGAGQLRGCKNTEFVLACKQQTHFQSSPLPLKGEKRHPEMQVCMGVVPLRECLLGELPPYKVFSE